jgi:hypothetical protein
MTEAEILAKYSTPGLRKGELSRAAKKLHLASCYRTTGEEASRILDQIYDDKTDVVDDKPT